MLKMLNVKVSRCLCDVARNKDNSLVTNHTMRRY